MSKDDELIKFDELIDRLDKEDERQRMRVLAQELKAQGIPPSDLQIIYRIQGMEPMQVMSRTAAARDEGIAEGRRIQARDSLQLEIGMAIGSVLATAAWIILTLL